MFKQCSEQTGVTLLTVPEAAQKLRISIRSVNYRMKAGQIPFVKIGKSVRFLPADLERFIDQHRIGGGE
jgi:DNA binding domain, excisionase family